MTLPALPPTSYTSNAATEINPVVLPSRKMPPEPEANPDQSAVARLPANPPPHTQGALHHRMVQQLNAYASPVLSFINNQLHAFGKSAMVSTVAFGIPLNIIAPFLKSPAAKTVLPPMLVGPMLQTMLAAVYGDMPAGRNTGYIQKCANFITQRLSFESIAAVLYGLTAYQTSDKGQHDLADIPPAVQTMLLGLTATVAGAFVADRIAAGGRGIMSLFENGGDAALDDMHADDSQTAANNWIASIRDRVCAHLSKPETWKAAAFDSTFLLAGVAPLNSGALAKVCSGPPEQLVAGGVALGILTWALAGPANELASKENFRKLISSMQRNPPREAPLELT